MQWSITCLVRLTYVFMALPATGVNLAWCLVSYRVALSRMASSILLVHILTGLASAIVASITLGPLVTPRFTLHICRRYGSVIYNPNIKRGGNVCVRWCYNDVCNFFGPWCAVNDLPCSHAKCTSPQRVEACLDTDAGLAIVAPTHYLRVHPC